MTIPGKGGRPRKWRSDADRVRAYRARQRGEVEPPTVEEALAAGDRAAEAWEHVRQLGVELEERRAEIAELRASARKLDRLLDDERRRRGRLEDECEHLRRRLEALTAQLDESTESIDSQTRSHRRRTGSSDDEPSERRSVVPSRPDDAGGSTHTRTRSRWGYSHPDSWQVGAGRREWWW